MKRSAMTFLKAWLSSDERKPLIIRGARQVGKTYLVRHFAKTEQKQLIELNFERRPTDASLFESNDPNQILQLLEALLGIEIDRCNAILFLDEIQAAPELLAKLRWFAEECAELAVIAAGSLLEFVLEEPQFSMPVGRIQYVHLEPFSFYEFLEAIEQTQLKKYLQHFDFDQIIPESLHQKLKQLFSEYLIVGGMPEAVVSWSKYQSLSKVSEIHANLLATYEDDFAKYRRGSNIQRLREVMTATSRQVSQKYKYSSVNKDVQTSSIKNAFELLCLAKLITKVNRVDANGVPLSAEMDIKNFKAISLDVGLCMNQLGLRIDQFNDLDGLFAINRGAMAEQVVGQALRTLLPFYVEPTLYYWTQVGKGSEAEIDYIIQHHDEVIPVEVKAGKTGTLKSLHLFMSQKRLKRAVRFNADYPSRVDLSVKTTQSELVEYELISLPFYLLNELHRLLD